VSQHNPSCVTGFGIVQRLPMKFYDTLLGTVDESSGQRSYRRSAAVLGLDLATRRRAGSGASRRARHTPGVIATKRLTAPSRNMSAGLVTVHFCRSSVRSSAATYP